MSADARETTPIRALARAVDCRYCQRPIYVAICRDGKWRSFEPRRVPAAAALVWAWRKRHGMEEQDLVPGHHLHYCAEYARIRPEAIR